MVKFDGGRTTPRGRNGENSRSAVWGPPLAPAYPRAASLRKKNEEERQIRKARFS
jgi:hypothetical protein